MSRKLVLNAEAESEFEHEYQGESLHSNIEYGPIE